MTVTKLTHIPAPAIGPISGGQVDCELDLVARHELSNHFRLERVLASRPGAVTYAAVEIDRKRPVVLRVRDRAGLEATGALDGLQQALSEVAALKHPNIVPLYRFGLSRHTVWWSGQLVRARTLEQVVSAEGPLSLDRAIAIANQIASGLLEAHDHGVAHGEVNPSNVLLRDANWAVIKDFVVLPESGSGRGTPRDDQSALALTVYRCLVGLPPEAELSTPKLAADLKSPVALLDRRPDLPASVGPALARALSPDPGDHYGSILDLVHGLKAVPSRVAVTTTVLLPEEVFDPVDPLVPQSAPTPRHQWIHPLVAAVTAVGVVAVALSRPWAWDDSADLTTDGTNPAMVTAFAPPPATLFLRKEPFVSIAPSSPPASPVPPERAPATAAPPKPREATLTSSRADPLRRPTARVSPAKPGPAERRSVERGRQHARAASSIAAAQPKPVDPSPRPRASTPLAGPGRLFISSRPWGQLYVDGRFIGPTPKAAVSVPAGPHRIRISRPGFRPVVRDIVVAPGADVRLIDLILEEGS